MPPARPARQNLPRGEVGDVVATAAGVWVVSDDRWVRRSRGIAQTRQTGLAPGGLAYAEGDVWVLDESTVVLHRFDPMTLAVSPRTTIRVSLETKTLASWTAVVASNDRLWALDEISDARVLVDPDRASPVRRDEIGRQPVALAAGASDAFVYDLEELRVLRFTSP